MPSIAPPVDFLLSAYPRRLRPFPQHLPPTLHGLIRFQQIERPADCCQWLPDRSTTAPSSSLSQRYHFTVTVYQLLSLLSLPSPAQTLPLPATTRSSSRPHSEHRRLPSFPSVFSFDQSYRLEASLLSYPINPSFVGWGTRRPTTVPALQLRPDRQSSSLSARDAAARSHSVVAVVA